MARLSRVTQLLFGQNANTASDVGEFGSLAAGSPVYTGSISTMQSLASWLGGWASAVVGSNNPALEDLNAVCMVFGYQLCYLLAQGIPEWDSGTTYYTGQYVSVSGAVYVSTADNNLNNSPTTDASGANWNRFRRGIEVITANTAVVGTEDVIEGNAAGGAITATLPAASTALRGKEITFAKTDSSTNIYTVSGLTFGTGIRQLMGQGDVTTCFCNGTSWYEI